ncbi:TMEM165/GDT1 family protein [Pseudonocardia acidicola]|uniref:TMEM165/GDT1 family protein n=1 Tax=Pseudonocardia acidicola TaxID=2724939 RepID=A0ABX1SGS4_9PSEU|nr:TMEM165/GDT1 family protein [Pseudonocardia acidicola]NMI00767.1 TMEM165/GDT1 family protein [Pseudonocardia acidicola]
MDGFPVAFAISFGVIFVAELGDKSQLMALTFATRYRALPVLVGITIATAVVHAVSVAVGYGLGAALPTGWIALIAAVAFLGFGAWTLRGDSLTDSEQEKAEKSTRSAVVAASMAFFLAELGDKTMLATITLATQHGWFGVWLGSTVGMVVADALAIVVGRQLGRHLPERAIALCAATLFFVFGVWLLADATEQLTGRPAYDVVASTLDHHAAGWIALGLGVLAVVAGGIGRRRALRSRADHPRVVAAPSVAGSPAWWARLLFGLSLLLGLAAPLLVAADLLQPIPLLSDPGIVVVGAGLMLLGVALVLASQAHIGSVRRSGESTEGVPALATHGLYSRVRNPGFTGMVVATAGTLLMVPTLVGVLATVLIVVAVQIQARAVREPGLTQAYGEAYAGYVERTGRFVPRIRPREQAGAAPGLPAEHADRARVG